MCGIVGMVSTTYSGFDWKNKQVFRELLYTDLLRGDDSTGAFLVTKKGNVEFFKDAKPACDTLRSKEYEEFEEGLFQRGFMAVGHNRKATKGTVNDDNAHPFIEKNTILVHNGTIRDHEKLTEATVAVDSHAILHSITERGGKETLADINGAYALAWYDADVKKLFLARNAERPLYVANTAGCWYFASEQGMLEWVLNRNGITVKDWTLLDPKSMYSFDLEKKASHMVTISLPEKKSGVVVIPANQPIIPWKGRRQQKKEELEQETIRENLLRLVGVSKNSKPPAIMKKGETNTNHVYDPSIFLTGSRLTVEGSAATAMTGDTNSEYIGYLGGHVYERNEIPVRVFFKKHQQDLFDKVLKDPSDIFTARIFQVHSKNGKLKCIHLDCPEDLVSTVDKEGQEVLPDDYTFLSMHCHICKKKIQWDDIPKSKIKLWRLVESVKCTCPTCLPKETLVC